MHHVIPPIHEEEATLKGHLQHAHDGHKKPRLQMLYLLASGQAHSRQEVARLLGVHRHTIGRGLALYAAGGLEALLATDVPAGTPVSLTPAVLASLAQALDRPKASPPLRPCASGCSAPLAWRSRTRRSTPWCARASRPGFKWPGPRPPKNPDAIPTVQATGHEHLQHAIPPENPRPIRVFSQDDSRFG